MIKSILTFLLVLFCVALSSCSTGVANLESYISSGGGYEFLYPNGWIPVDVENASEGVDVVYRDLIERSENLSVIISEVPKDKNITDLGTPSEVGYRFFKAINDDPTLNRQTELIRAESRENNGQTYYTLEYQVQIPGNQARHDLASVAVSHGKLYTLNLSTSQQRWNTVKPTFEVVANSFSVY